MLARPLTLSLLAAATAGCGSQLDTGAVEAHVQAAYENQAGIAVASVTCPSGVEQRAGVGFSCTIVTTAGDRAVVHVTQRDAAGHLSYRFGP